MNFQEAEKTYRDLRAQHEAGKLSDSTFEAEVGKLRLQDAQGRWWQIGVQTGEWYMHDGQKWNKAKPPVTAPAAEPAPAPDITAVIPRPAPPAKATAPAKAEAAPKKNGGGALPARLFSSKPAGRNGGGGGLPRNTLIAIIAGVAVLCVVLAVVGYALLQGPLSSIAKANTPTPTRPLVLPTVPPLPTQPPRPTDTPLPPPTPVVTITLPLPPTPTATRGAVVARTPTRTPTKAPQASPTVSAPPGVYALKLETVPSQIDIGRGDKVKVGFKLTLLNNTGGMQTRKGWFVRIFQDPEQTTGDKAFHNSYGESLKFDVNIGTGTVEITTPEHAQFGPGKCTYVAVPYYMEANNVAVPFQTIKGGPLYHSFKVCQ